MKKLIVCILTLSMLLSSLGMIAFANNEVIGYSSARVEAQSLDGVADILDYDATDVKQAYKITQAAGIVKLAEIVNGTDEVEANKLTGVTVYLAGDINMGLVSNYAPIGLDEAKCFSGTFDGQGHVIDNLKVNSAVQNAGLFGCIVGGTVKNLVIGSGCRFVSIFSGEDRFAAFVGLTNGNVTIDNCYNLASVTGSKLIAGFVGRMNTTGTLTIRNSTNAGAISGLRRTGGFVGVCGPVVLENCRNTGAIHTMDCSDGGGAYNAQHAAGGLIGESWGQTITMTNCINNGAIRAAGSAAGGLIGTTAHSFAGATVSSSFNYGTLTMDFRGEGAFTGGIVGHNATTKTITENNTADYAGQTDATLAGDIETITPNFIYNETQDPNGDPNAGPALNMYDDDVVDTVGVVGYSSQRVEKKDLTNVADINTWTPESNATEYKITDHLGMLKLAEIVNGTDDVEGNSLEGVTVYLANEIDMLDAVGFWSIGWNDDHPFSGTFDGQGYLIDNFQIYGYQEFITNEGGTEYLRYGMFGTLKNGTVKNVVIGENSFIYNESRRGHLCAGGIAGMVMGTCVIDNCYVMAPVSGLQHVGGIAGNIASFESTDKDRVVIRNCTVSGTVSAEYTVGGIVGDKFSSGSLIIKNCRATNVVENILKQDANRTSDKVAGGVIGKLTGGILVVNGFVNNAEITSKTVVGGVIGNADGACEIVLDKITLYGSMIDEEKTVKYGTVIGLKGVRAILSGEDKVTVKFGEEDATLESLEKPTLSGSGSGNQGGGSTDTPPVTDAPTTQAPTTQAPTTQAPTTQAPTTQAPTEEPKKGGCGAAIGGVMLVFLTTGAALTICKRKD